MRLFTILLILVSFSSTAQVCSGPGRLPETAFSVCGTLTFHQPDLPNCTGVNLPAPECLLPPITDRSVWYKFHCYQSGTLGFLITPFSPIDDYDWHLHDYTGFQPQDVITQFLRVSLNLSGAYTTTGCTAAGTTDVNCEGGTSPYNRLLPITAGHDYLLCVTNWSNSGLGYDLTFAGGTAVLTNNLPPTITTVETARCNSSLINILLSEDVLCSSLTAAGSEFTITNGTHVITNVSSACTSGSNAFNQLSLTLQNPLPPGNYQLVVNNGTDLNTLLDVCDEPLVAGSSFPFTVPAQTPIAVTDISYTGCAPTVLKVTLSTPVMCNSITATGSEFTITPPGSNTVVSVSSACTSGASYVDTLLVVLQNPLPHGNYNLAINLGIDINTLIDTCGNELAAGYSFPFTISQVTTPPNVQSIVFDECKPFRVVVNFDKPVACNTLSANGSEFSITPGTITVTSAISNCVANGFFSQVTLNLSGNLIDGSFDLFINNGTDGNTLMDSCYAFIPANTINPFVTTLSPPPVFDSVQYDKCMPSEIKVFYSKPINCNTVFANGMEFYITGPSTVNILSVSGDPATCSTSYSSWFILHLSQPINTFGTFVLHNRWGPDGNSVIDTCYAGQDTTNTIAFDVLGKPNASLFTGEIHWGCEMDTILFTHPGGNGINSWQWNFSDNTTASGQSVSHNFPASTVTATAQLIVSNGVCSDTLQRSYTLDNAFTAAFSTNADTVCRNSNVVFTNNSTGNNLQWLWQFGDNTTFNGQSPPAHAYATNDSFNIELIVTNNHGCADTATKKIIVTKEPVVDFAGLHTKYCTGETVALVSNMQGNISSYSWNNGNAVTVQNQPSVNFNYNAQGNYTISLTVNDRFCAAVTKDSSTQVFKIPFFSLGPDKTLCPGLSMQIGTDQFPGYTYLWSNGATGPKIVTATQSSNYTLTINNNGCIAQDMIFVKVLDNCLIKVPGAFTPNRDGTNDLLKAINADLATNFYFRVYNRFGQLMFATHNPLEGWDGTFKGMPAETATYVWQLSYVDPISKKPVYEKGASILIR